MAKIQMKTPLVEMDGDEMTRILWAQIKEILICPFVDLKTEYYDLGLKHRDETNDQVTIDSANAAKKYGVAVKCATITPNAQRVEEYNLKEMWKSPNGTIRAILDGTVFRAPILVNGVHPAVRSWKKPITIARHAYGDVYKNSEIRIPGAGKAELVYTGEDGESVRQTQTVQRLLRAKAAQRSRPDNQKAQRRRLPLGSQRYRRCSDDNDVLAQQKARLLRSCAGSARSVLTPLQLRPLPHRRALRYPAWRNSGDHRYLRVQKDQGLPQAVTLIKKLTEGCHLDIPPFFILIPDRK